MALKDHYRRVFNRVVNVGRYRRLSVGNLAAGTASGATICLLVDLWGRLVKFASEGLTLSVLTWRRNVKP